MKLFQYDLKLRTGNSRKGILINPSENKWGEIAPLEKWSKESFEEAVDQLKNLKQHEHHYPSVAFGLDSAKVGVLEPASYPVAALLMGSRDDILKKAAECFLEGFTHAKLKVAGLTVDEAFALISILKDQFRLRIDVNRAWSLHESLAFFSNFSRDDFDYIEEPVQNPKDLQFFTHPFALDETLREHPPEAFLHLKFLKAFIFKPSLLGGLSALQKLASHRKPVVMSSFFESGVGIFHIAGLIQRASIPVLPLGIDTYRFLENDLLTTPLLIAGGKLELPSSIEPQPRYLNEL